MSNKSPSFVLWFVKKLVPWLVFGAVIGTILAFTAKFSPFAFRIVEIIISIAFASIGILYSIFASRSDNGEGYHYSPLERVAILFSALGAYIISFKLGFPTVLPGGALIYFFTAFVFAFAVRPFLEHIDFKRRSDRTRRCS